MILLGAAGEQKHLARVQDGCMHDEYFRIRQLFPASANVDLATAQIDFGAAVMGALLGQFEAQTVNLALC